MRANCPLNTMWVVMWLAAIMKAKANGWVTYIIIGLPNTLIMKFIIMGE